MVQLSRDRSGPDFSNMSPRADTNLENVSAFSRYVKKESLKMKNAGGMQSLRKNRSTSFGKLTDFVDEPV